MLLTTLLALCTSHAGTVYVDAAAVPPGDGTLGSPYTRLDFAVSQIPSGMTVQVAAGTYDDESIGTDGKDVEFVTAPGAAAPVLVGSGSGAILFASGGGSATFTNFRFEGGRGYSDPATGQTFGGAASGLRSSLTFSDCTFADCRADFGGAVALRDPGADSEVSLFGCEIETSCYADSSGGGVYVSGSRGLSVVQTSIDSDAIYTDGGCIFSDALGVQNHNLYVSGSTLVGTAYEEGGAIACFGGSAIIEFSTVTGRSREDYRGGGLFFDGEGLFVSNVTFEDCAAISGGAACIAGSSAQAASPIFDSCTFRNNRTDSFVLQSSGSGGAVAANVQTNFNRCVFLNNTATHHPNAGGGAVAGNVILRSCTLSGNIASDFAGSIWSSPGAIILETIVVDGSSQGVPAIGPNASVQYCLVDEPYPGAISTTIGDPSFWSTDDVHLLPDSDAIDAGDPFNPLDPDGTRADAGAFPFDPSWCGDGCDGPLGQSVCMAAANSTGIPSAISGLGSTVVARDRIVLNVDQLPANALGYFVASQTAAFVPNPGGSSGNLCIGGSPLRFNATILRSTVIGRNVSFRLRPTALPGGGSIVAGQTWNFQLWHRDSLPSGAATSNFSPALRVAF